MAEVAVLFAVLVAMCGFFMVGGFIADAINNATGGEHGVCRKVHK